jgi:hypothetical protein
MRSRRTQSRASWLSYGLCILVAISGLSLLYFISQQHSYQHIDAAVKLSAARSLADLTLRPVLNFEPIEPRVSSAKPEPREPLRELEVPQAQNIPQQVDKTATDKRADKVILGMKASSCKTSSFKPKCSINPYVRYWQDDFRQEKVSKRIKLYHMMNNS